MHKFNSILNSPDNLILRTALASASALILASCATDSHEPKSEENITTSAPREMVKDTAKAVHEKQKDRIADWITESSDCELTYAEPFTNKSVTQATGANRYIMEVRYRQAGDYHPLQNIALTDFVTIQQTGINTSTDYLDRVSSFNFGLPGIVDSSTVITTPETKEHPAIISSKYGIPVRFLGNSATIRVYAEMDVKAYDFDNDSSNTLTAEQYCGEYDISIHGPHKIDTTKQVHKRRDIPEVVILNPSTDNTG